VRLPSKKNSGVAHLLLLSRATRTLVTPLVREVDLFVPAVFSARLFYGRYSSRLRQNEQVVNIAVPLDEIIDFTCLISMDEKLIIYIGATLEWRSSAAMWLGVGGRGCEIGQRRREDSGQIANTLVCRQAI